VTDQPLGAAVPANGGPIARSAINSPIGIAETRRIFCPSGALWREEPPQRCRYPCLEATECRKNSIGSVTSALIMLSNRSPRPIDHAKIHDVKKASRTKLHGNRGA
jgi:hypothetical protein